jgi:PAS domain S-box-containing protein
MWTMAEPLPSVLQLPRPMAPDVATGYADAKSDASDADLETALVQSQAREEQLRLRAEQLEQAVQLAQQQMARYHELFEFAPECYLTTDRMGNIQEANHAATLLLKRPRHFLNGLPLPFFVAAEDRQEFYHRLGSLCTPALPPAAWELRLNPHKGPPVDVAVAVTQVVSEDGQATGLRWLLRDITYRKEVERELRQEKAFTESLLDLAQAAVLVLDGRGRILRSNAFIEAALSRNRADLQGVPWPAVLGVEPQRAWVALQRAQQHAMVAHLLLPLPTADGATRSIHWSVKAVPTGDDAPAFLVLGHDITELEQAQRQALQMERLAAIGQMSAGLAHESRNALQRSRACLERLRWKLEGQVDALDLVERAQQASDDLVRLYEDVRGYAAPIHLQVRPCDLGETWRDAWAQLTAADGRRAAQLCEEADGVNLGCAADPFRLGQVFRNLLENALAAGGKSTQVHIRCCDALQGGRAAVQVAVCDNGPGLSPEQRQHLFEPFFTTKVRGTGLGLAICKRIVEAHGGTISASNSPEGGAEILITLPRSSS